MSQNSNNEEGSNPILHSSLLRGTLSIKATEMDIRRVTESFSITSTIETDYILQIESKNKVKFDTQVVERKKMSVASMQIQELETYHISKRYVDMRGLANSMRGHAESIVRYYEGKSKVDGSPALPGTAGIAKKLSTRSTFGSAYSSNSMKKSPTVLYMMERALQKPVDAMQYLTNTEPNKSNLVNELDSVFKKHSSSGDGGNSSGSSERPANSKTLRRQRTAEHLQEGTPKFVRDVIVGVDEFYEAIYSEKRQFSKKTNFDYVKSVAERRKAIINIAFGRLMNAFTMADLSSVGKKVEGAEFPVALELLVKCVEKFLVTDVLAEEGMKKVGVSGSISGSPQKSAKAAVEESEDSIGNSIVCPKSTRRRASVLDREQEVKNIKKVAELALLEESEAAEEKKMETVKQKAAEETNNAVADASEGAEGNSEEKLEKAQVLVDEAGILPDHPIDFALVLLTGALLFKWVEGRVMEVHMDMILMFGIACALVGYQLPRPTKTVHVHHKRRSSIIAGRRHAAKAKKAETPAPQDTKEGQEMKEVVKPRPTLGGRRSQLTKSNGSIDITKDQRRQSLHLIQASMRHVKTGVASQLGDEGNLEADDEPVLVEADGAKPIPPPAKTFPRFPEGGKLGAHLNCWSSPPSSNFHVRGPNYLKDKKKVASGDYLFPCRGCDLFLTDNPPTNLGRHRSILNGKLRDVPTFIINYRLPWGVFLSYHEIPKRFLPFLRRGNGYGDTSAPLPSTADMTAGERAMCNFLLTDNDEKNEVWKIVPIVVEGPWVVKRVVGGKPAIVGTKMPINYVYQPPEKGLCEYLEADLDIVSSAAARNILAVVRSYTQVLTIDLGYVVQGNKVEELPEQMMLGLRLHGLDPLTAELLPEFEDDLTSMDDSEYDSGNETE